MGRFKTHEERQRKIMAKKEAKVELRKLQLAAQAKIAKEDKNGI